MVVKDRLDDINGVTFDAEDYTKGFDEIKGAVTESIEDINRKEEAGVLRTEEANKRRKKSYDSYLEELERKYNTTTAEIEALQNKADRTPEDNKRLNFLVKEFLPTLLSEYEFTYAQIDSLVSKSDDTAKQAQEERLKKLREELATLREVQAVQNRRIEAEKKVNRYLGIATEETATQAELN